MLFQVVKWVGKIKWLSEVKRVVKLTTLFCFTNTYKIGFVSKLTNLYISSHLNIHRVSLKTDTIKVNKISRF